MKLFMFPVAPNPTKVRLYLAEKRAAGASIEVEEVVVNLPEGEHKKPELLARNPLGKLPVLETRSGQNVFESLPIIDYLEELCPEPSLWGPNAEARARARQIERVADLGVLLPIGRIVHTTHSPLGLPPDPHVAEYFRNSLPPALDYLEQLLERGGPFLAGSDVTVADCTLAAALQFGRFRGLDFLAQHPAIARWDAAYRARATTASVLVL
jgi:glutathione S-transferase